MKVCQDLHRVLESFKHYYNLKTEDVAEPFLAEAEFHSHNEQYLLVKAAKIADIDSNEYIFFAQSEKLTLEELHSLDERAWTEGLSRVKVASGHRNSDVALIIFADDIEENALKEIKKIKHYKSYKAGFYGWSHYRLLVYNTSQNKATYNRMGAILKKYVVKK